MTDLRYQLEFFSPWHCGSGMNGGNDADYVPILDHEELPFVPGKTVKGLFREAAETLFDADFVVRVFGVRDPRDAKGDCAGSAVWSNAELDPAVKAEIRGGKLSDLLRINRYFIKIDDNGQTEDHSLRRGEFSVPMTLTGSIRGIADDDAEKLIECMGFIKRLGLQRSRGFGVCRFSLLRKENSAARTAPEIPTARTYHFRCRFLTPVVLNNTGATEGVIDSLGYIPGANFLGIAARNYAEFGDEAFTVFHSGKVRFGAAYPLAADGNAALPCPATWFIPKGSKLTDGCAIFGSPEERELHQQELQPKQVRDEFFAPGVPPRGVGRIDKDYSLKSAYDSEKRRTEDGKLFGYTSLAAGSEWYFSLTADDDVASETLRRIAGSLIGRRQIGRSRNAQYGSVEIALLDRDPLPEIATATPQKGLYLCYAASPLAFVNEYGEPTLMPRVTDLGFPESATVEMRDSQIRYHQYCPWNGIRKSRDAERLVILPGSVIAIRSQTPPDPAVVAHGVGVFLAEGFGRIMCNPDFLWCKRLEAAAVRSAEAGRCAAASSPLADYLNGRRQDFELLCAVCGQVEKFRNMWRVKRRISASQWGAVRAIAIAAGSYDSMMQALFEKEPAGKGGNAPVDYERIIKNGRDIRTHDPGFLRHGKMAGKWGDLADALENFITDDFMKKDKVISNLPEDRQKAAARMFVELFAAQMAKEASPKEEKRR